MRRRHHGCFRHCSTGMGWLVAVVFFHDHCTAAAMAGFGVDNPRWLVFPFKLNLPKPDRTATLLALTMRGNVLADCSSPPTARRCCNVFFHFFTIRKRLAWSSISFLLFVLSPSRPNGPTGLCRRSRLGLSGSGHAAFSADFCEVFFDRIHRGSTISHASRLQSVKFILTYTASC